MSGVAKALSDGMSVLNAIRTRRAKTPLEAFFIGRADREALRPITLYQFPFGKAWVGSEAISPSSDAETQEFDVAYYAGYDPQDDCGLVHPEYRDLAARNARRYFNLAKLPFPPKGEPLSKCEQRA
jgi:hypothetical protein